MVADAPFHTDPDGQILRSLRRSMAICAPCTPETKWTSSTVTLWTLRRKRFTKIGWAILRLRVSRVEITSLGLAFMWMSLIPFLTELVGSDL